MHVYLDPETKRRNGELEFSTHTWAVKPLMHPSRPFGNADTKTSAGDKVPSATADFVAGNSDRAFGSLMPWSQKQTESPKDSLFRSNSATSSNNAYPPTPPKSSIFGTSQSSSTT
ncbi:MAG: hypothetical protein Q9214_006849, partial [Letrouitia sp. 1 TL-2023]